MDIEHLREFVVFSETMNYSLTARKLFMAKSTLIQHIRGIETELGLSLVDPTKAQSLTEKGDLFLYRIQRLLSEYDKILDECCEDKDANSKDRIRVFCPLTDDYLADLDFPWEFSSDEALYALSEFDALHKGKVDVAIVYSPTPDSSPLPNGTDASLYDMVPITPERCAFIMAKDHPLAQYELLADAPKKEWPIIAAGQPAYANSVQVISKILDEKGLAHSYALVRPTALAKTLSFDTDSLCIAFESAVETVMAGDADGKLIAKTFPDAPVTLYRFVICSKDNPNPLVHQLMAKLAEQSDHKRTD